MGPSEREDRKYTDFYPGAAYLDIMSLEVCRKFKQSYCDNLPKVAAGKLLALAEAGRAPTIEVLPGQPGWTWWMTWAGMSGRRRARACQSHVGRRQQSTLLEPERSRICHGECPDPNRVRKEQDVAALGESCFMRLCRYTFGVRPGLRDRAKAGGLLAAPARPRP